MFEEFWIKMSVLFINLSTKALKMKLARSFLLFLRFFAITEKIKGLPYF